MDLPLLFLLTALHVTLLTFRLDSEAEIGTALEVLNGDEVRRTVHYYWRQSRAINLEGVDVFRHRVVHATVRKSHVADMCRMVAALESM